MADMIEATNIFAANPRPDAQRWVVGLSGGVDSLVLLHLAASYRDAVDNGINLHALHVHHGLNPKADHWQQHCAACCAQWNIEFTATSVAISSGQPDGNQLANPEAAARRARYAAFRRQVGPDVLLLAHHQQDQVETLLYRLMRGSGVLGLRGMQPFSEQLSESLSDDSMLESRLAIWRPLLGCTQKAIEGYALQHQLSWVDDPSNQDQRFDRNYIRHTVLPVLQQRWPTATAQIARSARLLDEQVALAAELAELDWRAVGRDDAQRRLEISALLTLSRPRRHNLVRYWLKAQGAVLPSEKIIAQLFQALERYDAAQNTRISWGDDQDRWALGTYDDVLWLMPDIAASKPLSAVWKGEEITLALPQGLGQILITPEVTDPEVTDSRVTDDGQALYIEPGEPLTVRWRESGDQFRPLGRPNKRLKKWFQEWGVPQPLRPYWPVITQGLEILAVPDFGGSEQPQPPNCVIRWCERPAWIRID